MDRTTLFLAVLAALNAGHYWGDHWFQTQNQADRKGLPGWTGRINCLAHVATYTATQAALVLLLVVTLHLRLSTGWAIAGLAISAVTHYFADRREPLRRLAESLGEGKARFYRLASHGLNGAYLLDQSWHIGWIFIAALVASIA
jgi:hypothetical protein